MRRFPRNRLLWLNAATLALSDGRPVDAQRDVDEGFAKLTADPRPRVAGEEALWHYKRGAIRVALRRTAEAETDLRTALRLQGRDWVRGRAHTELARLAVLRGDRATGREELRLAARLCEGDNDPAGAADAMALLSTIRD